MFSRDSIWVEKYRPKTISECILPSEIQTNLQQFVEHGKIPNLMIHSTFGGSGKTTSVRALSEQLDYETLFINSSEQRGIETLRVDITQFVSTISLEGRNKCVILDEFDNCTMFTQSALRNFIEQFSHVRFFFTCNFLDKVLQPLQSRCTVLNYNWPKESHRDLKNKFFQRIKFILQTEGIEFNRDVVKELINRYFPDFRRTINELQRYSITGVIDEGLLTFAKEINIEEVLEYIKEKKFTEMRRWVEESSISQYEVFFKQLYEHLVNKVVSSSLPGCILLLASYQYKHAFVIDKQINLLALLTELMQETRFK